MVTEKTPNKWRGKQAEQSHSADPSVLLQGPRPDVGILGPSETRTPSGPGRDLPSNLIREDSEADVGCICGQECGGEEKEKKIMMISVAYTTVDKNAVVVHFGHAALANTAVL